MRGSWRAGKRKGELAPPGGLPAPPEWLDSDARRIYEGLAANPGIRAVCTQADGITLGLLADALAVMRAAEAVIAKEGSTATGSQGQPCVHPAVKLCFEAWDRAMEAARELGMTPASRVGLAATPTAGKLDSCFAP